MKMSLPGDRWPGLNMANAFMIHGFFAETESSSMTPVDNRIPVDSPMMLLACFWLLFRCSDT